MLTNTNDLKSVWAAVADHLPGCLRVGDVATAGRLDRLSRRKRIAHGTRYGYGASHWPVLAEW